MGLTAVGLRLFQVLQLATTQQRLQTYIPSLRALRQVSQQLYIQATQNFFTSLPLVSFKAQQWCPLTASQ